jgi:hypothetical protein
LVAFPGTAWIKFVEHRVAGPRILRLIQKWLLFRSLGGRVACERPLGVAAQEDKIVQQAVQALDALSYALLRKKVNYGHVLCSPELLRDRDAASRCCHVKRGRRRGVDLQHLPPEEVPNQEMKYGATHVLGSAGGLAFSFIGHEGAGVKETFEDHDEKRVGAR